MSLADIEGRISSSESDVLNICSAHMDNLLSAEKSRADRAEDKAQEILKMCGVGATIIAGLVRFAQSKAAVLVGSLPTLAILISAILLLGKSVYFSLRALAPAKTYQASEDLVFNVQAKTYQDTLRYQISVKIWLYRLNVSLVTSKVLNVHRALRNFGWFVLVLLVSSGVLAALASSMISSSSCLLYVFGIALLLVACAVDPIAERLSPIWTHDTYSS